MKTDRAPGLTRTHATFAALTLGGLALLPFAGATAPAPGVDAVAGVRSADVPAHHSARMRISERAAVAGTATATAGFEHAQPAATDFAIGPRRSHPAADALYETRNAAHGLHVAFTPAGIRVLAGPTQAELGMRLARVGYGERLQAVTDAALYARGDRIDYHRTTAAGSAFTEWYVNAADGLEQSFTFAAPVGTRREGEQLVVELRCAGDLSGRQAGGGDAVVFATADGTTTLSYDGLYAFDAGGRALPSHMEFDDDRLALVVDDTDATYPVTVDPKVKGGNKDADVEFRDAATDAILSDRGDGDTAPADYSDGVDKVWANYAIQFEVSSKGIKTPRQVQFDLGTARLLPRSSTQQYEGNHGDLPPGVGTDGILSDSDIRINNMRARAYVRDASSPSGWAVGPNYNADAMAVGEVVYMGLNVNLVRNHKSEILWRIFFGPGDAGPIHALDAQPAKLTRTSATTWTVEALDLGKGVRAALLRRVGTTSSHTFETVDHYSLPFKMTFTKQ